MMVSEAMTLWDQSVALYESVCMSLWIPFERTDAFPGKQDWVEIGEWETLFCIARWCSSYALQAEFVVTFLSLVLGFGNRQKTQECPHKRTAVWLLLSITAHGCKGAATPKLGMHTALAPNQNALALVTHMEIRSQETNTSWGWRVVSPGLQLQLHNCMDFVQYLLHNSQSSTRSEDGFPGFP